MCVDVERVERLVVRSPGRSDDHVHDSVIQYVDPHLSGTGKFGFEAVRPSDLQSRKRGRPQTNCYQRDVQKDLNVKGFNELYQTLFRYRVIMTISRSTYLYPACQAAVERIPNSGVSSSRIKMAGCIIIR